MSKLIQMRHSENVERRTSDCSCDACGRAFESPIRLTNLSAMSMQIYDACPFCFSKIGEDVVLEETNDLNVLTINDSGEVLGKNQKNIDSSKQIECPHHFGYLKKRPKNMPIPDICLTCEKMIKCVL